MNHIVRNSALCTTDWCDAKKEIERLKAQVAELTKERDAYQQTCHNVANELSAMTKERDELDHEFGSEHRMYLSCQARIVELREALDDLLETCELNGMHDDKTYQSSKRIYAAPEDSSALDRRLQEERERCAKVIEPDGDECGCAAYIRSMK